MRRYVISAQICNYFAQICNFWAAQLCNRVLRSYVKCGLFLYHFFVKILVLIWYKIHIGWRRRWAYWCFLQVYPKDRVFKTSNMKSFVRQLNLYGFHKVQVEKDVNFSYLNDIDKATWPETVFAHAYFRRSHRELLGKTSYNWPTLINLNRVHDPFILL